jgi:hypothetical protein
VNEDVEGAASVDEHLLKPYVPNDGIQNEGKRPGSGILAHWSALLNVMG